MAKNKFYSGFISLVGRPNVGKSTLMNRLIGEKIAIISPKPQTTRNRIQSILTKDDFQVIFIDTPGIHKPKHKLGNYMVKAAETTLNEVDAVFMLVEPTERVLELDRYVIERLEGIKTPVILVINKIDTIEKSKILTVIDMFKSLYNFAEIIPISAKMGENTDQLMEVIKKYLPEGPQYFPEDMVTDQPERQIAAEIIREKALQLLQEEIPHGIAVEISAMKKRSDKDMVDVEATIYCEKDSHKGIIIGKQGAMLKKIGTRARVDISALLGSPINLQIWIKVKKDWRDSDFLLKNFGYDQRNI
ncbi:MAG: GTPase Era [Lachnospiraceae bacterium]|nr:GTPase Era [Lachnospiraceae bacterium]